MTRTSHTRFLLVLAAVGALICGYLAMQAVYAFHLAHAQVPDGIATSPGYDHPVQHPIEAATSSWAMVRQYGWIWGMMIAFAFAGSALLRDLDGSHWLHATWKGRLYLGLVGLAGTAGAAVEAHFGANTWSGVVVTAVTAAMLVIQGPKPLPTLDSVGSGAGGTP